MAGQLGMWTCQRITGGARCGWRNSNRCKNCRNCGKARPPRRKPAHMAALKASYEEFVRLNGGVETCGICGASQKTRRLHRDHEHVGDGKPRGLLCFRCNAALRPYMTVEWLRAAAMYLERTR